MKLWLALVSFTLWSGPILAQESGDDWTHTTIPDHVHTTAGAVKVYTVPDGSRIIVTVDEGKNGTVDRSFALQVSPGDRITWEATAARVSFWHTGLLVQSHQQGALELIIDGPRPALGRITAYKIEQIRGIGLAVYSGYGATVEVDDCYPDEAPEGALTPDADKEAR